MINKTAKISFFFSNLEKNAGVIRLETPNAPAKILAYKLAKYIETLKYICMTEMIPTKLSSVDIEKHTQDNDQTVFLTMIIYFY